VAVRSKARDAWPGLLIGNSALTAPAIVAKFRDGPSPF
jgi:hypothetical protein